MNGESRPEGRPQHTHPEQPSGEPGLSAQRWALESRHAEQLRDVLARVTAATEELALGAAAEARAILDDLAADVWRRIEALEQ